MSNYEATSTLSNAISHRDEGESFTIVMTKEEVSFPLLLSLTMKEQAYFLSYSFHAVRSKPSPNAKREGKSVVWNILHDFQNCKND